MKMNIKIDVSEFGQSQWYEYLIRFVFGGSVTALAGFIASHYGPAIGGLFLAFPAILPATASLIEKHEVEKYEDKNHEQEESPSRSPRGTKRGRAVAGIDASGAALGSIGLAAFALVVWKTLPKTSTAVVLLAASAAWLATSLILWELRETFARRARAKLRKLSI